jgi:F-type H+-transporting ATPase subunit delta
VRRGLAVARRYARALFGLAPSSAGAGALLAEVDALTDAILGNEELRRALFTPLHPRPRRKAIVAELAEPLGLSPEVRAFAALLADENRMQALPEVRDALRALVDRASGRVEAEVVSARPLGAAEARELAAALSRRVGSNVTLEQRVDPSLLGGVLVRVGDLRLDGSLRGQLSSLAESLRKGSA